MNLDCENCGFTPSAKNCAACGESVPTWAKFCPFCGQEIKSGPRTEGSDPLAMENRRLCPDGNCIGILGADGRCVVCGQGE